MRGPRRRGADGTRRGARPSRRRIVARQVAAIVVLALLVAGTIVFVRSRGRDDGVTDLRLPAATGNSDGPASHVSFLERLIPPPPERVSGPAAPRSLADLARRLPLERAVAQLFLFGFSGTDATAPMFRELDRLDVGGLVLDSRNYESAQQVAALAAQLATAAADAHHLPPWIAVEQDGGDYSQFPDLPPALPPGGYKDAPAAAAAFTGAATSLKALGINALLGPDLDVSSSDEASGGPLGQRALSDDAQVVADYARRTIAACRQLQLLCAPKHFPGLGAADAATDERTAQVGLPLAQLLQRDVVPFAAAVKAKATAVVVGEGLYEPDDFVTPAALSPKIIGGLLRKRLRFGGLAITDDLADPGVSSLAQVPDAAVDAVKAGADLVYISGDLGDQEAAYTAVLNAVRAGTISEPRLRQSLLRVLVAKGGYNLLVTKPRSG